MVYRTGWIRHRTR